MSDSATLVERLRVGLMASAAFVRGNPDKAERMSDAIDAFEEAAARIAELEAERDRDREMLAQWMIANSYATGHGDTTADLLGELKWQVEAERDKARARIADTPYTTGWKDGFAEGATDKLEHLEADRDRLKAALQALCDDCAEYIRTNNLYRGDGSSATENQVMRQARAALSAPSGE